jgi:hypothetical protein
MQEMETPPLTEPPVNKKRKLAPSTAWTALGCGCAAPAVLGILLIFGLLVLQEAREKRDPTFSRAALAECENNLRHLNAAMNSYGRDHKGQRPINQLALVPLYLDERYVYCPLNTTAFSTYGYDVTATGTQTLYNCGNHGQGEVILQADGRIRINSDFEPSPPPSH